MASTPAPAPIPSNPQPIEQVPVRIDVPRPNRQLQEAHMATSPAPAPIPANPQPLEQVPLRRDDPRPYDTK